RAVGSGTSPVNLSQSQLLDTARPPAPFTLTTSHAEIVVAGEPLITPTPSATPSSTPTTTATATATPSPTPTTTATATASPTPSMTPTGTITITPTPEPISEQIFLPLITKE
ncbi:MAG: hypothetical protein KDD89_15835, partial [Anaerolineales bacterium]|nr:hypothetical protein [Anaerolineales bacterium]